MSLKHHSLAGTIRIEPRLVDCAECESDDSMLDLLLASFAHRESLDDSPLPARGTTQLIASRRLSCVSSTNDTALLRANLAQLLDDLQAELDQLDGVAS